MIKFSVLYPADGGTRFDHDYYRTTHMPLLKERLGAACFSYTIDKGISGREPGSPAPFVAGCHLLVESVDAYHAALAPHAAEVRADLANYTDIIPVIQFSEVVEG